MWDLLFDDEDLELSVAWKMDSQARAPCEDDDRRRYSSRLGGPAVDGTGDE
jgi:hypothetical protein